MEENKNKAEIKELSCSNLMKLSKWHEGRL